MMNGPWTLCVSFFLLSVLFPSSVSTASSSRFRKAETFASLRSSLSQYPSSLRRALEAAAHVDLTPHATLCFFGSKSLYRSGALGPQELLAYGLLQSQRPESLHVNDVKGEGISHHSRNITGSEASATGGRIPLLLRQPGGSNMPALQVIRPSFQHGDELLLQSHGWIAFNNGSELQRFAVNLDGKTFAKLKIGKDPKVQEQARIVAKQFAHTSRCISWVPVVKQGKCTPPASQIMMKAYSHHLSAMPQMPMRLQGCASLLRGPLLQQSLGA